MQHVVHKAEDRGVAEHGWLHSRFSFSFADWYNPERMGFGALRVINDDVVDPASGFGMHPHRDMEIITIVMDGAVSHEDSMGNKGTVRAGEVQVMSAGTGVVHSEMNESPDTALALFQIWIFPDRLGHAPRYAQLPVPRAAGLTRLVGPEGSNTPLFIHQDASVSELALAGRYEYTLRAGQGLYVLVVTGTGSIVGVPLNARDAVGIWDEQTVLIEGDGVFLLIEVPIG